ncbi:hypothetical protein J4214_00550 [Candidatus Woesearchaeota archaeon]|nr:hypothetical protein [Candidatus Woesearchaeota archaeon]
MEIEADGIKEEEISHFAKYFPNISGITKSNTYSRESRNVRDVAETEKSLIDKMKINSINLHKFEKKHNEFPIFRSGIGVDGNKKGKIIVYTLVKDKGKYNILLLRLINHKKWISILDNKKTFKALIDEIKHYQLQN